MTASIQLDAATMLPILDGAFDGIALFTRPPLKLHFVNRTLAGWLDRPATEVVSTPPESVFGTAWQNGSIQEQLSRAAAEPGLEFEATLSLEFSGRGAGDTLVKAFHVAGHDSALIALVMRPLSSPAVDESWLATRVDPLTALPDRAFLLARLAMLLEGDRVADREFAVLFIDLDNFKQINDRHGHLMGDRVLREVGQRLQGCVRDCDHVTRFGGDEFVVLLERVSEMADIEPVLARIRAALANPILVANEPVTLSLSIGVARSASHLRSPEDVLNEADREMYAAKRSAAVSAISAGTL